MDKATPVSYTHLDVYKRQPLECNNVVLRLSEVYLIAAEAGCKLGGDAAVQGLGYLNDIVTVSYTHLDVYKRQTLDEGGILFRDHNAKEYRLVPGESAEYNRQSGKCLISRPDNMEHQAPI